MYNILRIFKERAAPLVNFAGQGKIFHNTTCDGNAYSYDVEKINSFFETNHNTDHLLQRMVIMMEYLQQGYHTNEYPGPAGKYKHAITEYPEKYMLLVRGLSDKALQQIRSIDMSKYTNQEPKNLGTIFYNKLILDRMKLTADQHYQPKLVA